MCRGLSMATPRFVIIVITAASVSTMMGATWENSVLAETPTPTRVTGGNPPTLSHTRHTEIRRVIREGHHHYTNNNKQKALLRLIQTVALTPSNPWMPSTKRHRRHSQSQLQQTALRPNANFQTTSSSLSFPIISSHNTHQQHPNQQQQILQHLHNNQQSHLLLTSLDLSSPADKAVRSWARLNHGQLLPFHGTLTSQESTISSGGGGTDTQKLFFDAKSQSPSSSSLAAATAVVNAIRCACDTGDCTSSSGNACLTTGMCYTQFLDRGEGSRKLIRGCIGETTPLLCENRRPSVGKVSRWPYLHCCNSDMCNAGGLTIPSTFLVNIVAANNSITEATTFPPNPHHHVRSHHVPDENSVDIEEIPETTLENHVRTPNTNDHKELSPGIISFFVGSAVYVIVLSALGFVRFFLWRRKQSQEACYYRKDLEQEGDVDEDRGVNNEICLSSPVNTEETIDYEPNQISISIPCHHYTFQQGHHHHDHSSCVSSVSSAPTHIMGKLEASAEGFPNGSSPPISSTTHTHSSSLIASPTNIISNTNTNTTTSLSTTEIEKM